MARGGLGGRAGAGMCDLCLFLLRCSPWETSLDSRVCHCCTVATGGRCVLTLPAELPSTGPADPPEAGENLGGLGPAPGRPLDTPGCTRATRGQ